MLSTATVLESLAWHLDAEGVARYNPVGIYSAGDLPAIVFGNLPSNLPAAIAINSYDAQDTRQDGETWDVYVQLRFRHGSRNPLDTARLADTVSDLLHRTTHRVWPGGTAVTQAIRVIVAPMDQDDASRWTRPDSYRITLGDTP